MCDLKAELKFCTPKALRAAGALSHLHGCVCNYNPLPTPLAAAPRFEPAAQRRFASLSSRALRRVVLLYCGRHPPTLHFACLWAAQAQPGDKRPAFRRWTASGKLPVATPLKRLFFIYYFLGDFL